MRWLIACCMVCLPLKNLQLSSNYGYRIHPVTHLYRFHSGVDLHARGDTVFAILDGKVDTTGYQPLIGIHIRLSHGDVQSVYGHLSQIFVNPHDAVYAGEPIGITGATGRVTGEHLHFSIKYQGQYIDPMQFIYQLLIQQHHE